MIFNLKGDVKVNNPFVFNKGTINLYPSFEAAIEDYEEELNFLNPKINDNTYWADGNIDTIIKDYLYDNRLEVKSIIDNKVTFEFAVEAENEIIGYNSGIVYTLDKRIFSYFKEKVDITNNINDFILLMRSKGIIEYSYEEVCNKLTQYFGKEYKYYIPVLYKHLNTLPTLYNTDSFEEILNAKTYLEKVKVYNLSDDEFDLKRDKKGLYAQFEYNDSLTGRIFPSGKNLQTLSKEKRNCLIAEENCYLIEFDFKTFEFNILLDLLKVDKVADPHTNVIEYLGVNLPRKVGKDINYAFLYGMNPEKICQTIKDETEVEIDVERLKSYVLFEKKKNFKINIEDGIIYTYFNRPIKIEKEYAAFQNYISGTASDIFFKKFNEVKALLPYDTNNKIIIQNHDSILIQLELVTINNTDIVDKIYNILTAPIKEFTFSVDISYGKVWSELK